MHDERIGGALGEVGDLLRLDGPFRSDCARGGRLIHAHGLKRGFLRRRRARAGRWILRRGRSGRRTRYGRGFRRERLRGGTVRDGPRLRGFQAGEERFLGLDLQRQFGSRSIVRHADFPRKFGESQHLRLDGPRAVGQVRKGKYAALIGGGYHFLVTLYGGDRDSRNGQSTSLHRAVVIRSQHSAHGDAGHRQAHQKQVTSCGSHIVLMRRCRRGGQGCGRGAKLNVLNTFFTVAGWRVKPR